MKTFSHIDEKGNATMVGVGDKINERRKAIASGKILMSAETIKLVKDNNIKKGDVITVAKISGIQAAKKTSELIPLCHPLMIENIQLESKINDTDIELEASVFFTGKTGVEMEALTAVSIALLTIYDMCKAVDKNMKISEVKLLNKTKSAI